MRKFYLIVAAFLLGLAACTDFEQEVESNVLEVVENSSLDVEDSGGSFSVMLKSGSKWDVTTPGWIKVKSINMTSTPFQWKIDLDYEANTEPSSRTGIVEFKAGGRSVKSVLNQKGLPVIEVESITLDGSATLEVGESMTLVARVYPNNATDKTVSWSSSNPNVVSVTQEGKITALKGGDPVTITASAGGKSAKCTVTVRVPVTGVTLDRGSMSLVEEDFSTLTATVRPSNATDKSVTWSTSNSAVATVQDGRVTAVKAGSAVITVKTNDKGFSATCSVTVTAKKVSVKSISITPESATLSLGEKLQLKLTVTPSNATDQSVKWTSSSNTIATVDDKGLVEAVGGGSATITATSNDGGKTATCSIKVNVNVESVSLSATELKLHPGEGYNLTATVKPDAVPDKSVSWTTSNSSVATVSNGYVSAVGPGTAEITATSNADKSKSAKCTVKVGNRVTGISVNPGSLSMQTGESAIITYSLSPDKLFDNSVSLSTVSGGSIVIAKVLDDSQIKVTANAKGTDVITISSVDNPNASTYVSVTVTDPYAVPQKVDLGLSVKWGSFNVGASSAEEFGDAFSWGETAPKVDYSWGKYLYCQGSKETLIKYNFYSQYGNVDNKDTLEPGDDAATTAFGDKWRTPSPDEIYELMNECRWEWREENGVTGYRIYGKKSGYTGNSIFIPAAGYRSYGSKYLVGTVGYYWSSGVYSTCYQAYVMGFSGSEPGGFTARSRCEGLFVRPVYGDASVFVTGVTLDRTELEVSTGNYGGLVATVQPSNATNKKVTWSSDDTSIATVDTNGNVKGISVGSTYIRVTTEDGGYTASCHVTVVKYYKSPAMVDLGLSVSWGSFNLGAESPSEDGDYFAWGETRAKNNYQWSTYLWANGAADALTKYCTLPGYGNADYKSYVDEEDDVAHVRLGGRWRLPSKAEMEELMNNCTWTWTRVDGVAGFMVYGPNGKSIFLPASGRRTSASYYTRGSAGLYMSAQINPDEPWNQSVMYFTSAGPAINNYYRYFGVSVRPVNGNAYVPVTGVTLDHTSLSVEKGGTYRLYATVSPSNASNKMVTWSTSNSAVVTVDQSGSFTAVNTGTALIIATTQDGGYSASCTVTVTSSTDEDYEWFLGTWRVPRGDENDYWEITTQEYGKSYHINGIDGFDYGLIVAYDSSNKGFVLTTVSDITTEQINVNNQYYDASVNLVGYVYKSDEGVYSPVTGSYPILRASRSGSYMRLTPGESLQLDGYSSSQYFDIKGFGFIFIFLYQGTYYYRSNYTAYGYFTTLPQSVSRYSGSYAPVAKTPAKILKADVMAEKISDAKVLKAVKK